MCISSREWAASDICEGQPSVGRVGAVATFFCPFCKTYWTLLQCQVHSSLRLRVSPATPLKPLYSSFAFFPSPNPLPGSSLLTPSSKVNKHLPPLLLSELFFFFLYPSIYLYIYMYISLFCIIHITGRISQPSLPPCYQLY